MHQVALDVLLLPQQFIFIYFFLQCISQILCLSLTSVVTVKNCCAKCQSKYVWLLHDCESSKKIKINSSLEPHEGCSMRLLLNEYVFLNFLLWISSEQLFKRIYLDRTSLHFVPALRFLIPFLIISNCRQNGQWSQKTRSRPRPA